MTSVIRGAPVGRLLHTALLAALLAGCSLPGTDHSSPASQGNGTAASAPESTGPSGPSAPARSGEPTETPVALRDYFDREYSGTRLRLGDVRERAAGYTSYDATYRSEDLTVSGVINVPNGDGPFPAVVLAHGWIEPDAYASGQGMTRERGHLADQGFIAFHIDYRNHADSDRDPDLVRNMYLGYAVDAVNAVHALRGSGLPIDPARVALMGRSMGGNVVLQALEISPGLVQAGIVYSGQSSLESDNYRRWAGPGSDYAAEAADLYGTPEENPEFWTGISTRPQFSRITEPVLMIHGTEDEQCPEAWAGATFDALQAAGIDAQIEWYEGERHAFGPRFEDSMDRSTRFLRTHAG
ncbi:alpha/beta fold hydrolase [Nocardioides sp. NPDC023903]|uniref:alpha/beta hydrolase family protein n=1 Tax=Nocardioides sp. NPDC023903 TaxID=3157195 RepID=UPI0034000CAD